MTYALPDGYLYRMNDLRILAIVIASGAGTACGLTPVCTLEARPGISAVVRDSVTGAGLAVGTIAVAREGVFLDTLRGVDSLLWGVYERAGTYQLQVSRSGYQSWSRNGVRVSGGDCHVETARVLVLLVPE